MPRAQGACIGDPEEVRTPDLRLRKPTLYPTELQGHFAMEEASTQFDEVCRRSKICAAPLRVCTAQE